MTKSKNFICKIGVHTWGVARTTFVLLPVSVVSLVRVLARKTNTSANAQLRWMHCNARPGTTSDAVRVVTNAVTGVFVGGIGWLGLLLAVPNTVRNVFLYGVLEGDGYQNAWGGPTLAGAWATHAAIAISLLPVYLVVLSGLMKLQSLAAQRILLKSDVGRWVLPLLIAVIVAGLLFVRALVHQG